MNDFWGRISSFCILILILLITVDVLLRYVFNISQIWMMESEVYLFAFVILMSGGIGLKEEKHIRIDVLYSKLNSKWRRRIDTIGIIFFLIPWCVLSIIVSTKYFYQSFSILESSPQPGGIPYMYLFKLFIPVGFSLLLIQGFFQLIELYKKE